MVTSHGIKNISLDFERIVHELEELASIEWGVEQHKRNQTPLYIGCLVTFWFST